MKEIKGKIGTFRKDFVERTKSTARNVGSKSIAVASFVWTPFVKAFKWSRRNEVKVMEHFMAITTLVAALICAYDHRILAAVAFAAMNYLWTMILGSLDDVVDLGDADMATLEEFGELDEDELDEDYWLDDPEPVPVDWDRIVEKIESEVA